MRTSWHWKDTSRSALFLSMAKVLDLGCLVDLSTLGPVPCRSALFLSMAKVLGLRCLVEMKALSPIPQIWNTAVQNSWDWKEFSSPLSQDWDLDLSVTTEVVCCFDFRRICTVFRRIMLAIQACSFFHKRMVLVAPIESHGGFQVSQLKIDIPKKPLVKTGGPVPMLNVVFWRLYSLTVTGPL